MDKIKKILQGLAESIGKLNRLSLPATILIASLVLGGFFYASQVNKQRSIERQQQIDLQAKTKTDQVKAEQDKRDYIAKRKTECLAIYKAESDKWNNTQGWHYIEPLNTAQNSGGRLNLGSLLNNNDKCEIYYKDNKTGENFSKYY